MPLVRHERSCDKANYRKDLSVFSRRGRVDYVFVHKVDRLARNRVDDVEITLAIKKAGATLVSATENIDETPSGMLLHGIMSSIAEFYSRNLATEVHKGMSQKAKTGGTPGKAPLGYLNVVLRTPEGREERTVEVDPERAELISWAFEAFASGTWTLRSLADELETRGLTTQQRITDQLTTIEARLGAATATFDAIETNLTRALDLARDCHSAYLAADPQLRRLFNQAFFTHLMIDEDGVHSEYAEPFDTLLDGDVLEAGQTALVDRAGGQAKLREVLERPASSANKKTTSTLAGGLSVHLPTPVRGVEGSNKTTLVPPTGFEPATPANGSRTLPHNKYGEADSAANHLLRRALATGSFEDAERILLGRDPGGLEPTPVRTPTGSRPTANSTRSPRLSPPAATWSACTGVPITARRSGWARRPSSAS
ncbi:recombinase family protein [Streptomyces phaeochromogenes]|uniref:recombinase family protein n=1 Tax=Streptomyces phaeochromogenes TaxID=1923 RepID=UPI0038662C78|nr:recombinase family protein [Streptomyces phaeochromogenes]